MSTTSVSPATHAEPTAGITVSSRSPLGPAPPNASCPGTTGAIASPQPRVAATHAGSSPGLAPAAAAGFAHGDAPAYDPIATSTPWPTSASPITVKIPARLPSSPSTANWRTALRASGSSTSRGSSFHSRPRTNNGATPGRPAAPSGHISPTSTPRGAVDGGTAVALAPRGWIAVGGPGSGGTPGPAG